MVQDDNFDSLQDAGTTITSQSCVKEEKHQEPNNNETIYEIVSALYATENSTINMTAQNGATNYISTSIAHDG